MTTGSLEAPSDTRAAADLRERGLWVTDLRSAKEHELERDPHVGLTFVDQKTKAYLAITGHGAITKRERTGAVAARPKFY